MTHGSAGLECSLIITHEMKECAFTKAVWVVSARSLANDVLMITTLLITLASGFISVSGFA